MRTVCCILQNMIESRVVADLRRSIPPLPAGQLYEQAHVDVVATVAHRLVDLANESLRIANDSKQVSTRRSRIAFVREKLAELQSLCRLYSFLKLPALDRFEEAIRNVERETDRPTESDDPLYTHRDIIKGYRFVAIPSFSTPLATLMHHGDIAGFGDEMPAYERGGWHPDLKSFREVGLDIDEPPGGRLGATDAGMLDVDGYVAFLKEVKLAAIGDGLIEQRAERIDTIAARPEFRNYADALGGVRTIIERTFPKVLDALHFLPELIRGDLLMLHLATVAAIDAATDEELFAIPGMGKERLRRLRTWCCAFQGVRTESRLEPTFAAELADQRW